MHDENFTEATARAKIGKRVRVRDDSFSQEGIPIGTTGTVVEAKPSSILASAGAPQAPDPNRDIWTLSIRFDDSSRTCIDIYKEEYQQSLEEIEAR